jgi:hypothetical protein
MSNVTAIHLIQFLVPVDLTVFSHQLGNSAGKTSTTADQAHCRYLHGSTIITLAHTHLKGSRSRRGRRMRSSPATTDTRFSCSALKVRRYQTGRLYSLPSRLDCAIHEG